MRGMMGVGGVVVDFIKLSMALDLFVSCTIIPLPIFSFLFLFIFLFVFFPPMTSIFNCSCWR